MYRFLNIDMVRGELIFVQSSGVGTPVTSRILESWLRVDVPGKMG